MTARLSRAVERLVQEAEHDLRPMVLVFRDLARKVVEEEQERCAQIAQEHDDHICFTEPSPQCKTEKPSGCVIAAAIREQPVAEGGKP